MFIIRFDRIHERDRQTDGIASHGKNEENLTNVTDTSDVYVDASITYFGSSHRLGQLLTIRNSNTVQPVRHN